MIFQLGADVTAPDGARLGELHRIVFDAETAAVVSLVVTHSALDGREVLIPREAVETTEVGQIQLALDEGRFASYRDFESTRNVAPPFRGRDGSPDSQQDSVNTSEIPAVGAASGIESIAFVPLIEETYAVRVGETVLGHDTSAYATDGEVGRVIQVLTDDDTDRISRLVVERGFFFKHDTEIPIEFVENVIDDSVVLTVTKAELEALNASH